MGPTNSTNGPNMGFGPLPGGYQTAYPAAPDPKRKKLAIFFVVGVVAFVLLVVFSLLSARKDPAQEAMVDLVIAQNEMLRVSKAQTKLLSGSVIKRHNAELDATINTNALLAKAALKRVYNIKGISNGEQKQAIDKKTDDLLASSAKLNRLDEEYAKVVSDKLAKQVELAQQAQGLIKDQQAKQTLTTIANSTTELRNRFTTTPSDNADTPGTTQP